MRVKELIAILQKVDPELLVGRTGHFGELHEMDKFYFDIKWDTSKGWDQRRAQWFEINFPDIGEEPD